MLTVSMGAGSLHPAEDTGHSRRLRLFCARFVKYNGLEKEKQRVGSNEQKLTTAKGNDATSQGEQLDKGTRSAGALRAGIQGCVHPAAEFISAKPL